MTDELNLETTPEEDLPELDELCELDEAEEEALEEALDEEEPKKCCCSKKRKLILIGGIAIGLAIAAILALIFANRAKKD